MSAVHISEHSLFSWRGHSQDHGRLPAVHISEHSLFSWRGHSQDHGRLPEHVSMHSPSDGGDTLKIAVGCPPRTYPSVHTKTCTRVGLLGPRGEKKWTELKSSRVATKHCVKHCAEITFVSTLLEAITSSPPKKKDRIVTVWEPGTGTM